PAPLIEKNPPWKVSSVSHSVSAAVVPSSYTHSYLSLLSDCGGGCRDGRCRGGGCRYGGRRREEEEEVVDAVMVDAMVVDMDTMVEDVRRRKWWFSFV
ncbi:hypothetical protein HID58_016211, partial [Brassica napus]